MGSSFGAGSSQIQNSSSPNNELRSCRVVDYENYYLELIDEDQDFILGNNSTPSSIASPKKHKSHVSNIKVITTIRLVTDNMNLDIYFPDDPSSQEGFLTHISRYVVHTNLAKTYKLMDKIDKGGFGTVYKASKLGFSEGRGIQIALKVIQKEKIVTKKNYVSSPNPLSNNDCNTLLAISDR